MFLPAWSNLESFRVRIGLFHVFTFSRLPAFESIHAKESIYNVHFFAVVAHCRYWYERSKCLFLKSDLDKSDRNERGNTQVYTKEVGGKGTRKGTRKCSLTSLSFTGKCWTLRLFAKMENKSAFIALLEQERLLRS